jgi:hypothetical protein
MQSYFEMQKSDKKSNFSDSDEKNKAEIQESQHPGFSECPCIPRSVREQAIDKQALEFVQETGKTELTFLSIGSGNLGQEYHINKLLTTHGIYVQWLLIDPEYGKTDESWNLLHHFKECIEKSGSGVLGAYSDISGYAAFKLGKTAVTDLNNYHSHLFTKTWADLFSNHILNKVIFKRKWQDFESTPLPAVDLILIIDLNPTNMSGYQKTRALTHFSMQAALHLDPEAKGFSVVNKNSMGAKDKHDLEIEKPRNSTQEVLRFSY